MSQDDGLIASFIDEAWEHLATIQDDILKLEKLGGQSEGADLVDRMFRAMHTIKGNAGFFGFDHIRTLAHALEDLMSSVRNGDLKPSHMLTDALLEGVDRLGTFLEDPQGADAADLPNLVARLRAVLHLGVGADKGTLMEQPVAVLDDSGVEVEVEISGFDAAKVEENCPVWKLEFDLGAWERRSGRSPVTLVKQLLLMGTLLDVEVVQPEIDIRKALPTGELTCRVVLAADVARELLCRDLQLVASEIEALHIQEPSPAPVATPTRSPLQEMEVLIGTVSKGDLGPLIRLMELFQKLAGSPTTSEAFATLCHRLRSLSEKMVMEEVPFEEGLKKLRDGVAKTLRNGAGIPELNVAPTPTTVAGAAPARAAAKGPAAKAASTPTPAAEAQTPESIKFAREGVELIRGFVDAQLLGLEEFEVLVLEREKGNPAAVEGLRAQLHTVKGEFGILGMAEWASLVHQMEDLLINGKLGCEQLLSFKDIFEQALRQSGDEGPKYPGANAVKSIVGGVATKSVGTAVTPATAAAPVAVAAPAPASAPVAASASAPVPAVATAPSSAPAPSFLSEPTPAPETAATPVAPTATGSKLALADESLRVPVERLDQLIDAIGEAVIAHSMVSADPVVRDLRRPVNATERALLRQKVMRIDQIMRQIQELSMSLRMVNLKTTFQKMARLVRDLSKKMDKPIRFDMEGEDTELDKSVVERIGDPLIHMIRNSVDHGVESRAERKAAGKPEEGVVTLRAYHKAGSVVIEVQDDGKGLRTDKIRAKAIERGIISATANLSDQEIWALIFAPGFSTADQVTEVSGRGVGMDVVRRNIEALHGAIEIFSEEGKGSTFTIRLPLTLAIIDGMVIRMGDERYIIPTLSVVETVRPSADSISTVTGRGEIIRLRSDIVRVVRLTRVLNSSQAEKPLHEGIVLIVEDSSGKRCGLAADEILEQQQVVIKKLGSGMQDVAGISGGAIMNTGEVSLLLDVAGILRVAQES